MNEQAEAAAPKKEPRLDSTLSKGLMVLEALTAAKGAKGVSELSRELELTKSNVFRLLQTLAALGYVQATEDKLYRATLKTWQVGRAVVENFNLRDVAGSAMQMLSTKTGEAIYLAVQDGLNVVYIDKIDSTQPIRSWNPVAGTAPIHCVGTGKAILAASYGRMRERMIGNLTKFTDRTITSIKFLDEEMAATQGRGYAIDTGEFRDRIRSFGAAISLPDGEVVGALGVSVPEINLEPGDQERICDLVKMAAESVTHRLQQI
ncbi:IclR family transcriptional regulator [Leisingera sp. ANG-M1]|uniref:IclR family transcriptional regulator n=1 Tax=Leisingera sp. ANG-M1 TaxID=1577895 RepID=UPI00068C1EF7|nr:IclR family transcriptional regulator [Leisingera sp. ANG-M1]